MKPLQAITTLGELPAIAAAACGDKVALICGERQVTYRQFEEQTRWIGQALRGYGIASDDRVAMLLADPADAIHLVFGAARANAVSVNINARLAPPEIAHILSDCEARLLVVDRQHAALLARVRELAGEIPPVVTVCSAGDAPPLGELYARHAAPLGEAYDAEDVVVQIYTSGTTGRPKGVQLPNRSFFALPQRLHAAGEPWIGWTDRSVSLVFVPLFHIGGLWWLVRGLALGSANVVLPSFNPAAILRAIPEYGVTKTCMVPAMAHVLLREPGCRTTDFSSLETIVYGGSPMDPDLLQQAMAVFGCDFCQIYGMTETGNMAVCFHPGEHRQAAGPRLRAAGRPLPGVELRIVDADGDDVATGDRGEILISSPAAMVGYWRAPVQRGGDWIATGDVGYRDEHGFVYICDRVKDMIISAGENIYPAEIEQVLRQHPAVADAAVIGIPDRLRGEAPKAIIVPVPGAAVSGSELVRHARAHLAEFKVPTAIHFVQDIPRNASGKVLKTVLREQFGQAVVPQHRRTA
jgi:long-chain acyl-CoA synthetase